MNFDEAIRAHSDWKMKFNIYLSKPDGSINPQDLANDNLCALGKWLSMVMVALIPVYQNITIN